MKAIGKLFEAKELIISVHHRQGYAAFQSMDILSDKHRNIRIKNIDGSIFDIR